MLLLDVMLGRRGWVVLERTLLSPVRGELAMVAQLLMLEVVTVMLLLLQEVRGRGDGRRRRCLPTLFSVWGASLQLQSLLEEEEKIEMHSKPVPSPQEARLEMPRIAAVTFRRRVRWFGGRTGGARAGQKLWKKRIGIPSQIVCGTSCFHLGKKKSTGKRRRRHSQKTNDGGGGGGPGGATFLFGGLLPRSHRHRIWMLLSSPPSAPRRRRSVPKASLFRNSRAISAAFWEEGLPGSFRLRYRRERRTRIQRFNPYQWFPSVCLFLSLSPSPLPLPKESLHAD